jgi:protein-S-isoprenylcysteine O-methyltransferase Ste14
VRGRISLARVTILIELFILTGFIVGFNVSHRLRGKKSLGEFPIHPLFFVVGKLAMGISWGFLFVQAAGVRLALFPIPTALEYVSAVLLLLATASIIPAFLHLGSDSRFGVSEDSGGLRTRGIYRVSRNPMYLGFYLVTLASLVSVPHPVNVCCGLLGVYVHHLIVLAEERFLQKKHGASYDAYRRRVRRYIGRNRS